MNHETADRYCERGILGLVLAILVWGPLAAGAVRTQELLVLVGLTAAALGLWLVRLWLNERPMLLWPPVSWAVLAFVAYAIGRYFTCDREYVGRLELLRVLVYAALFFLIVNNLHGQEYTHERDRLGLDDEELADVKDLRTPGLPIRSETKLTVTLLPEGVAQVRAVRGRPDGVGDVKLW